MYMKNKKNSHGLKELVMQPGKFKSENFKISNFTKWSYTNYS